MMKAVIASSVFCLALAESAKPLEVSREVNEKFRDLDLKRKEVSWHKDKIPVHLRNTTAPVLHRGGCGQKVLASGLGLKRTAQTENLFLNATPAELTRIFKEHKEHRQDVHGAMLPHYPKFRTDGKPKALSAIQRRLRGGDHPGFEYYSKPGVGAEQELADNDLSLNGNVGGVDPYVSALKDGYFLVGCFQDSMLEFGDKFGNNADKYRMSETAGNVSIVLYSELILKESQKPMTPTVCYEFCRTMPAMTYFGITAGKDCYCTPFYSPTPGNNAQCDQTCEGDSTKFCGNMKGKSSIWEMHLCADGADELNAASAVAREALDFYFENALLAHDLGKQMSESAEKLEEVGGVSGSETTADMARVANKASKAYTQAYMKGAEEYDVLLKAVEEATELENGDFSLAATLTAAEHAAATMTATSKPVMATAADIHKMNQAVYPLADQVVFGEEPDSADGMAILIAKVKEEPDAWKEINFRPITYAMGAKAKKIKSEATSCSGPTVGAPLLGMGLAGCAAACESTVYPKQCKAFSLFNVDGVTDLCFLLADVGRVEAFECSGEAQSSGSPAGGMCMVKMTELSTGYKPKAKLYVSPRCFSSEAKFGVTPDVKDMTLPGDTESKSIRC